MLKLITNSADIEVVKLAKSIRMKNSTLMDLKIEREIANVEKDYVKRNSLQYYITKESEAVAELRNSLFRIINE